MSRDNGPDRGYYRYITDLIEELRPGRPEPQRTRRWNGAKIRHIAARVILSLCLLAAIAYAGDYLVARFRLMRGQGLGSVSVGVLYAIPQKSGKTEFADGGVEVRTCLHSLFPHFGYAPCWYLSRHREQRTNF